MITIIGVVSGEILSYLEEMKSPASVQDLAYFYGRPHEVIVMAVDWLVREGLIQGEQKGKDFIVWMEEKIHKSQEKAQEKAGCGLYL